MTKHGQDAKRSSIRSRPTDTPPTDRHLNPFSLSLRINTQEIASTLIPQNDL